MQHPAFPCTVWVCQLTVVVISGLMLSIQGWSGENCSFDIDECLSKPCQHGGTCRESGSGGGAVPVYQQRDIYTYIYTLCIYIPLYQRTRVTVSP